MARDYAAVPHSYLKETALLTDEEFGRLMRGLIAYSQTGIEPDLPGRESLLWMRCKLNEDAVQEYYDGKGKELHERAVNAANARWSRSRNANASDSMHEDANASDSTTSNANDACDAKLNENEIKLNKTKECVRHARSVNGWVKLSDAEYQRLVDDLGEEETARCIAYLDESAQSTGNKNKWKDWNVMVRKASRERWGIRAVSNPASNYSQGDDVDPMIKAILQKRREAKLNG